MRKYREETFLVKTTGAFPHRCDFHNLAVAHESLSLCARFGAQVQSVFCVIANLHARSSVAPNVNGTSAGRKAQYICVLRSSRCDIFHIFHFNVFFPLIVGNEGSRKKKKTQRGNSPQHLTEVNNQRDYYFGIKQIQVKTSYRRQSWSGRNLINTEEASTYGG